jgi:hypothetical protein
MVFMEIGWGVEWIQLAQDKGQWRALVIAVLAPRNYLVSIMTISHLKTGGQ